MTTIIVLLKDWLGGALYARMVHLESTAENLSDLDLWPNDKKINRNHPWRRGFPMSVLETKGITVLKKKCVDKQGKEQVIPSVSKLKRYSYSDLDLWSNALKIHLNHPWLRDFLHFCFGTKTVGIKCSLVFVWTSYCLCKKNHQRSQCTAQVS